MKIQKMKVAKKQGDKKKIWGNTECKVITDSGINSKEGDIEAREAELEVIYDGYRDVPREIYEERFKTAARKLYKAQEVAIWGSYRRYDDASEDIHEEVHENRDKEAVTSHQEVLEEIHTDRSKQRDIYKEVCKEKLKDSFN